MKKAKIYMILNKRTNLPYIGSTSNNIECRWNGHKELLRKGNHNSKFQKAWDESVESDWEWIILEKNIPLHVQFISEQYWLDSYQSYNKGYNVSKNVGSFHNIHPEIDSIEEWYKNKQQEILDIMKDIKEGISYRKISKKHNISLGSIGNIKQKWIPELVIKDNKRKSEAKRKRKEYNDIQNKKEEIRFQASKMSIVDKIPYRQIAEKLNISNGTVGNSVQKYREYNFSIFKKQ